MQFDEKVLAALDVLTEAAENDYELYRICTLVRDLVAPPQVEVIDETHQRFNGHVYRKEKNGYYVNYDRLHRDVWQYCHGQAPRGFDVHHDNENKDDNHIPNLVLKPKGEHQRYHNQNRRLKLFTCVHCGKEYIAPSTGPRLYCSTECMEASHAENPRAIIKCKQCGKELGVFDSRKFDAEFCSTECYHEWQRANSKDRSRQCQHCGKTFIPKNWRIQKYCSRVCAAQHRKGKPVKERPTKICPVCGKEFELQYAEQKYCSRECAGQSFKKSIEKVCPVCGKTFPVQRCRSERVKTCSRECGYKLKKLSRAQSPKNTVAAPSTIEPS